LPRTPLLDSNLYEKDQIMSLEASKAEIQVKFIPVDIKSI